MINFLKSHKKITAVFIIAIFAIFAFSRFFGGKKEEIKTAQVKRGDIVIAVSASGKIKAKEAVDLKFQTSGKLIWVGVKEGDKVKKGQAIAQLDQRELQKDLEKALRDYSKERNDFEEEYRVTYGAQTPQTALTNTIRRILEKNQWDLEKAVLDVELKDLALKYSTLVTPIDGIVTQAVPAVAGVNIVYTSALYTVANPNSVVFSANIDETEIKEIKERQETIIILDAYPDEEIKSRVANVAFSSTATSGGGTAFAAEFELPANEDERFRIGMNGDTEIIIAQKINVLTIPLEAVKERDGKKTVRLFKEGEIEEIEVTVGLTNDTEAEITSGVKEGELVVTSQTKK